MHVNVQGWICVCVCHKGVDGNKEMGKTRYCIFGKGEIYGRGLGSKGTREVDLRVESLKNWEIRLLAYCTVKIGLEPRVIRGRIKESKFSIVTTWPSSYSETSSV